MAKKKSTYDFGRIIPTVLTPIDQIKENPKNPRKISPKKFKEAVQSVIDFPQMLKYRPLVLNKKMEVIGGNVRLRACIKAGYVELPTINDSDLTVKERKEFIIKDNLNYGDWDWPELDEWKRDELEAWGLEIEKKKEDFGEGEEVFSEYLGEANNYVVLMFDNDIDWLSAQTHFKLKAVYSKRQNGKKWSKGIGRVVNGAEYLKGLQDG